MFPLNILGNATKQRKSDGGLDVLMAVNRGSYGLDDTFPDTFVAGECSDLLFIFLGQAERSEEIFLLVNVVRLDDGGENGEAILGVEGCIEVIAVNTGDFLEKRQSVWIK